MTTVCSSNRPIRPNWFGYLTVENTEEVAEAVRNMLSGKYYTFVAVNSGFSGRPEVKTSRKMDKVYTSHLLGHSLINVNDSYGVWGFSTTVHEGDQLDASRYTYVVFDWNQIKVEHFAPCGYKLNWVIALENHD